MSISEPFIRRPIATALLSAALALIGIVTFPLLPIAPLPQVDFPTISISAQLPGASPDTMAATVAAPLERQFGQIAGITQMTSVSTLGSTSITLQFELTRNVDAQTVDGDTVIVSRGLNPGENVVVRGQYRLQAGTRVDAKTEAAKSGTANAGAADDAS